MEGKYSDWTDEQIQAEINAFKLLLNQTDYKSLKHADGALTDEQYEETRLQRQSYRDAINELEEEQESREKAAEAEQIEE